MAAVRQPIIVKINNRNYFFKIFIVFIPWDFLILIVVF